MSVRDFIWAEKYRPRKIEDCVLPAYLIETFKSFVKQGDHPNLLLSGQRGVGKTTVAIALCEELGRDWIKINGSKDGNIDTLRNQIQAFASTVSFTSNARKCIILDEADGLNPNSTQPAPLAFMAGFSQNCVFILTCNYKGRIIPEIAQSRLAVVDFRIAKEDFPELASRFMSRVDN